MFVPKCNHQSSVGARRRLDNFLDKKRHEIGAHSLSQKIKLNFKITKPFIKIALFDASKKDG